MKCHLCDANLAESEALWNVGGRRRVTLRCIDNKCGAIRVTHRSEIEVILPDDEVVAYRLLVRSGERWYRIWGRKNSEEPSDTAIYEIHPTTNGNENHIITVPRFYPISTKDDLKNRSNEILNKLKTFVIFS